MQANIRKAQGTQVHRLGSSLPSVWSGCQREREVSQSRDSQGICLPGFFFFWYPVGPSENQFVEPGKLITDQKSIILNKQY